MKNVKELLNTIKGLDKKKKAIIAGSTAGVVTIGVIAGLLLMGGNKELAKVNDLPTLSREEVEEKSKDQVVVEETEEEKLYVTQSTTFARLIDELNELGVDTSDYKEVPEKDKIASVIEELNNKVSDKKEEIAKKEEEKDINEEVEGVSSNSGQASQSTQKPSNTQNSTPVVEEKPVEQKPVEQKPVEQPVVEQKPVEQPVEQPVQKPSTPAVASGWKDDIAQSLISKYSTPNTNNTNINSMDVIMTPSQLANLNSWAQQWLNGSLSESQFRANASGDAQKIVESLPATYLSDITFSKNTYNGYNPSDIGMGGYGHHYIFCKVYYDASSDVTTVYSIRGTTSF